MEGWIMYVPFVIELRKLIKIPSYEFIQTVIFQDSSEFWIS